MILPVRRGVMRRPASRSTSQVPTRFTRITCSNSCPVVSSYGLRSMTPAAFTTMSTWPWVPSTRSKRALSCPSSVTSQTSARAPPQARATDATSSSRPGSSHTTSRAPRPARARAPRVNGNRVDPQPARSRGYGDKQQLSTEPTERRCQSTGIGLRRTLDSMEAPARSARWARPSQVCRGLGNLRQFATRSSTASRPGHGGSLTEQLGAPGGQQSAQ